MPYCIHCGVKLTNRYKNCPLCQTPVEFYTKNQNMPPLYPKDVNKISILKGQTNPRDWITIHFIGFITFISLLLTTGLDLYLHKELTWSLISTLSILFAYTSVTATLHLKRNLILLYVYINLILGLFLFSLNIVISEMNWFKSYALPCFISLQLTSLAIKILFRYIKSKMLRGVTTIIATNIFIIGINKITAGHISWSLLISSIFIPTAIFILFLFKIVNVTKHDPSTI